jgi:hypothetical protein
MEHTSQPSNTAVKRLRTHTITPLQMIGAAYKIEAIEHFRLIVPEHFSIRKGDHPACKGCHTTVVVAFGLEG